MQTDVILYDSEIRKCLICEAIKSEDINIKSLIPVISEWFYNFLMMIIKKKYVHNTERVHDYNFYLLETACILDMRLKEIKIPIRISFHKRQEPKQKICDDYFQIISRLYVSDVCARRLDTLVQPIKIENANSCGCKEEIFIPDTDNDLFASCYTCGVRCEIGTLKLNYNDSKRTNTSQKNLYVKRTHFIDCIDQFQGKQKSSFSPTLLSQIEKRLEQYHLIDRSAPNRAEQFARVDKKHIQLILKELNLTRNNYEKINIIHHLLTDKPLNNISHLKEKLKEDFDKFNEQYNKRYPYLEKKPFNYQHLLYQFLCRHKYKCNLDDFNFLKTTDRKSQHDDIYREIFNDLGWNYISLF